MQRLLAPLLLGPAKAAQPPASAPELQTTRMRRKERLLAAVARLQDRDTHKAAVAELEEAISVRASACSEAFRGFSSILACACKDCPAQVLRVCLAWQCSCLFTQPRQTSRAVRVPLQMRCLVTAGLERRQLHAPGRVPVHR